MEGTGSHRDPKTAQWDLLSEAWDGHVGKLETKASLAMESKRSEEDWQCENQGAMETGDLLWGWGSGSSTYYHLLPLSK